MSTRTTPSEEYLSWKIKNIDRMIKKLRNMDHMVFVRLYHLKKSVGSNILGSVYNKAEYVRLTNIQAEITRQLESEYSNRRHFRDMLSLMY